MGIEGHADGSSNVSVIGIDGLIREALDEQAAMQRLETRAKKFMTEAAFHEFPALKSMNADQIREFGQAITRVASEFALKSAHIAYGAEQET